MAADFEVTFNTAQLLAGAEAAWNPANQVLGREFQKSITSNKWQWPSGDSPRDIVDLGQLRDSYDPDPETPTTYRHSWPTEYAMAVHEGAVFKDDRRPPMPARPWVRVTLRDYDFATAFGKLASAEMRKRSP